MSNVKPTIYDVARVAGVSRATVSRVMNDVPGASQQIRTRVLTVAAQLGYRPSGAARALATGRTRTIDVIAVTYGPASGWLGVHPYYSRVLTGVMSALEGDETLLRIRAMGVSAAAETIDEIAASSTAGAILANITPELADYFYARSPRAICLVPTASDVPALLVDNIGGAQTAVNYLHRLGRRHIAAIHGPDTNTCAASRRVGYRTAVERFGLPEIGANGGFRREGGYDAAARLLDQHPEIDAMFVACDLMAAGAVQAITATGRRVPEDVSIVGFDDSIAATCANPPLTTMRLPVEQMAEEATRMLLDGVPPRGYRKEFPVELIERESTVRAAA
jgi:DNA-binding LacI/PurR family transcriptional regulator